MTKQLTVNLVLHYLLVVMDPKPRVYNHAKSILCIVCYQTKLRLKKIIFSIFDLLIILSFAV